MATDNVTAFNKWYADNFTSKGMKSVSYVPGSITNYNKSYSTHASGTVPISWDNTNSNPLEDIKAAVAQAKAAGGIISEPVPETPIVHYPRGAAAGVSTPVSNPFGGSVKYRAPEMKVTLGREIVSEPGVGCGLVAEKNGYLWMFYHTGSQKDTRHWVAATVRPGNKTYGWADLINGGWTPLAVFELEDPMHPNPTRMGP